jgi:hypothetical protein
MIDTVSAQKLYLLHFFSMDNIPIDGSGDPDGMVVSSQQFFRYWATYQRSGTFSAAERKRTRKETSVPSPLNQTKRRL